MDSRTTVGWWKSRRRDPGRGGAQPGTNQIPDYYALQGQRYLVVTGFEVADVPVSIGRGSSEFYEVPADKEYRR